MLVRKMRILRMKYQITLPELARYCGLSPQRISEIELNAEVILDEATAVKVTGAFSDVIMQRRFMMEHLESAYLKHKDTLLDAVEETTYEL